MIKRTFLVILMLTAGITNGFSQEVDIKTNLLYDATTTFNLGVEFGLGGKTSLDVPFNYNPWTFSENKKWKHFLVQPEFRLWTKETFKGSFFGLHAHYALYNVGGLNNPPFSDYMNEHRFEGWLAGAGVSYGYRWNFSHRWGMEATVGVGYAYLSYDKYPCENCGVKLGRETKNYFGPTKAGITLIYRLGNKKQAKQAMPQSAPVYVPDAIIFDKPAPKPVYQPVFAVSYITPEVEALKVRAEAGNAFLDFAAGASAIKPEYKNNSVELRKIQELVAMVKNDPNATITGITINGFASPEGAYAANVNLSEKRAAALKAYIKKEYGFADNLFTVSGIGEDWVALDSLVSKSEIQYKAEVLEIIRGTDAFDGRERRMMALAAGAPYRQMLAELFPQLRRSEYQLHYTVLPFTVEKGKEVLKTRPPTLSLNEMFLIAQTYEKGSPEFNEVFETAVVVFPQSDVANLNAAAAAIERKDYQSAQSYLAKVRNHNSEYYNNLGIIEFRLNESEKAGENFRKAAGSTEAAANLDQLQKYLDSLTK